MHAPTPRRSLAVRTLVTALLLGASAASPSLAKPAHEAVHEAIPSTVREAFSAHCTTCHDADESKGGVNLDLTALDLASPNATRLLEDIHRVLSADEMPPKRKSRPSTNESTAILQWIDETLTQRAPRHHTTLRRLNRTEYARTISQVFGIPFRLPAGFPDDALEHGFDNVAGALHLSPPLLEAYIEVATSIADQIFPEPQEPLPPSETFVIPPADLSSADGYGPSSLLVDGKMRLIFRNYQSSTSKFVAKASGKYRVRFKASAFKPVDNTPFTVTVNNKDFTIPTTGDSEQELTLVLHPGESVGFQFKNAAFARIDANFPYKGIEQDLLKHLSHSPRHVAAWLSLHEPVPNSDTNAIRLQPFVSKSYEIRKKTIQRAFEDAVEKTAPSQPNPSSADLKHLVDAMLVDKNPSGVGGTEMHFYVIPMVWKLYSDGPALDIHGLEIEGPLEGVEHYRYGRARGLQTALTGTSLARITSAEQTNAALQRMLQKLFRRNPSATETERYAALVRQHTASGADLADAFHLALRTAMISPQFLYRNGTGEQLAPHELASRLSYFLTLSPPDTSLLEAANTGKLGITETLAAHTDRLLESKLRADFIENFVGQWLGTRQIPLIMPDPSLGRFSADHQRSVMKEPELVFNEILEKNLPVTDLIDPGFTHTHPTVGRQMYGLDLPPHNAKQAFALTRLDLPRGSRSGGILSMAGVMMATANGVDTQPVLRGKWFLENVLGDPPPPPPESVPALTPDTRGAATIRDLMNAHTSDERCARCHTKIDPYGFLFENFDAIGQWREAYPVANAKKDKWPRIDSASTLPNGTPLEDVAALKRHLLADPRPFVRCLTRKLFTYAVGRAPDYAEAKTLNALADQHLTEQKGLKDLIRDLVLHEAFLAR
jgi:mono/diheme cytochrome c family protein